MFRLKLLREEWVVEFKHGLTNLPTTELKWEIKTKFR